MMLPPQVIVIPMYLVWAQQLHLAGSLWPLIIPMAFGDAYSIFLLRQFLLTIPQEYIESAKVDGCGELRTLLQIIVPMARPGIAAVALFQFFYCWNDYFGPQIYAAQNPASWTLSYGLESFKSAHSVNWNLTMAATLLVMAPVIARLLLRTEGLRRRRHAHRSEGLILHAVSRGRTRPRLKLAVVGGGSTYTPELIDGFARLRDVLPLEELVLIDPAADRLELVGGLARRIFAKQGHPGRISWTGDLDAGVDGADAVLLQLRIGGQAARNQDETWPLECGCVGQETTGAGGLAKALRTVPVVLDIAERVRRRNPDAWIVDFTNPVGIVTRALLTHGHKAVGLCNVAIGFQRKFAAAAGRLPRPGRAGTRRPQPPHLGAGGTRRAARTSCPGCWPNTATPSPTTCACRARSSTASASSPPTTCATTTSTTRSYGSCAASPPAPRRSPPSSSSSWGCTATRRSTRSRSCCPGAAAPSTRRPRWR